MFSPPEPPPTPVDPAVRDALPPPGNLPTTPPSRMNVSVHCLEWYWRWVKLNTLDILSMVVVGVFTLIVDRSPWFSPPSRWFPIADKSGRVIDPSIAYHWQRWTISSLVSGLISLLPPMFIYAFSQMKLRSAWDFANACMGTLWAVLLGAFIVTILKTFMGGLRPAFLHICLPDRDSWSNYTAPGGQGFGGAMWTSDICTQEDKGLLKMAMSSFPSGHASAAWAGWGFLFLWLNGKLKVWTSFKASFWKFIILSIPLLGALLVCGTLILDHVHHWYDILVGGLIGIVTALASYRASYAAIWDPHFNHAPLIPGQAFEYNAARGNQDAAATRENGWDSAMTEKDWSTPITIQTPDVTITKPRPIAAIHRLRQRREMPHALIAGDKSIDFANPPKGDHRTL